MTKKNKNKPANSNWKSKFEFKSAMKKATKALLAVPVTDFPKHNPATGCWECHAEYADDNELDVLRTKRALMFFAYCCERVVGATQTYDSTTESLVLDIPEGKKYALFPSKKFCEKLALQVTTSDVK